MENKDIFKKFYDELYSDILDEYYVEISNVNTKNRIFFSIKCILFSIIPTLLLWLYCFKKEYLILFLVVTIFYNIGIILFIKTFYKEKNEELLKKIKYKILDDMITFISKNENGKVLPDNRISKESFEKTDLFDLDQVKYNGSNFIKTELDDNQLVLADINIYTLVDKYKQEYFYKDNKKFLRTYRVKQKNDLFTGCYIGSKINRRNDILIQVIPKANNKIKHYFKLCENKIYLENNELSEKYDVYADDEVKARMIMTLPMMEKINDLDKIIDNKKYIIFKPDGRYVIMIEDMTLEDILNRNLKTNHNKNKDFDNMYKVYQELLNIFEIAHIINKSR